MALYAREVLTGDLPGPYTDQRALTFARLALLDPARDAAQRHRGDDELAAALQLPVTEILAVHREQQPHDDRSARPRHRYQPPTAAGPTEVGPTPPCRAAQRRGRARWR